MELNCRCLKGSDVETELPDGNYRGITTYWPSVEPTLNRNSFKGSLQQPWSSAACCLGNEALKIFACSQPTPCVLTLQRAPE